MGWTAPFMCISLVRVHVPGFGCKPDCDWDLARRRRGRLFIMTHGTQAGTKVYL
uniref:Uncharacterized protein n=1 Tax=Physcomitrium patens TaxID=3218 RepID=A0A7I4AKF9_PHYPA